MSNKILPLSQTLFYEHIKTHVAQKMEDMLSNVPFAKGFHDGSLISEEYYKRHLIEAINRIKLNNEVDAYCLYKIDSNDAHLFGELAKYLVQEYGHDRFLLSDLRQFNITQENVANTAPFFSTQLLIGYLYFSINKDGPLVDIAWNWFVEWYSHRYNMRITKKVGEELGIDKVEGSLRHLSIDNNEDHESLMFCLMEKAIKGDKDKERLKTYLTNFVKLIGMYFQELYEITVKDDKNFESLEYREMLNNLSP